MDDDDNDHEAEMTRGLGSKTVTQKVDKTLRAYKVLLAVMTFRFLSSCLQLPRTLGSCLLVSFPN